MKTKKWMIASFVTVILYQIFFLFMAFNEGSSVFLILSSKGLMTLLEIAFVLCLTVQVLYLMVDDAYRPFLPGKWVMILLLVRVLISDLLSYQLKFWLPQNSFVMRELSTEMTTLLLLVFLMILLKNGAFAKAVPSLEKMPE